MLRGKYTRVMQIMDRQKITVGLQSFFVAGMGVIMRKHAEIMSKLCGRFFGKNKKIFTQEESIKNNKYYKFACKKI